MGNIFNFIADMFGSDAIEIVAVFLGVANIVLLIRRSIWNYPFGILMVTLYAKIFFDYRLYSDSILQIFFFSIQCYGWWYWLKNRDVTGHVTVRKMRHNQYWRYGILSLAFALSLGFAMSRYTDADFPFWDSTIASLSVVAQILLSRRYIENWLVWILVDVLAIGLFLSKGLMPTAVLYCLFLTMAYIGWRKWKSAYHEGSAVE